MTTLISRDLRHFTAGNNGRWSLGVNCLIFIIRLKPNGLAWKRTERVTFALMSCRVLYRERLLLYCRSFVNYIVSRE